MGEVVCHIEVFILAHPLLGRDPAPNGDIYSIHWFQKYYFQLYNVVLNMDFYIQLYDLAIYKHILF